MKNNTSCDTKNRIVVHTGSKIHASVCPKPSGDDRDRMVEIFSDGWATSRYSAVIEPDQELTRSIAVEFIVKEPESYSVSWLELIRRLVLFQYH